MSKNIRTPSRLPLRPLHITHPLQPHILLTNITRRIPARHIEIINPKPIIIEEPRRPRNNINRKRPIRRIDILRLMPMSNKNMVHPILPNQIQVPPAHPLRERPVIIRFVFRHLEGEMVVRDDDFLVRLCACVELVLEPGPFFGCVVFKFGHVADKRDRVEENEAVAFVAEGAVVADVVVVGELFQGCDVVDVVVSGEEVDGDLELRHGILESLDFIVVSVKLGLSAV
jgi:hypothetical protein